MEMHPALHDTKRVLNSLRVASRGKKRPSESSRIFVSWRWSVIQICGSCVVFICSDICWGFWKDHSCDMGVLSIFIWTSIYLWVLVLQPSASDFQKHKRNTIDQRGVSWTLILLWQGLVDWEIGSDWNWPNKISAKFDIQIYKKRTFLENIGKYHNCRQLDGWFWEFQVDGN